MPRRPRSPTTSAWRRCRRRRRSSSRQLWNCDLSDHDADGPLRVSIRSWARTPSRVDGPGPDAQIRLRPPTSGGQGRSREVDHPRAHRRGHRQAELHRSPGTVAEAINHLVQADASDGFILVPTSPPAARPVRRPRRPTAAGARSVPDRLRGHHVARPPRPGPACPRTSRRSRCLTRRARSRRACPPDTYRPRGHRRPSRQRRGSAPGTPDSPAG